MIDWLIQPFQKLTNENLYDMLMLREEVFTLEQKCSARDCDDLDKKAIHILGIHNGELVAYARVLPPELNQNMNVSFGRFAIKKDFRKKGIAYEMMEVICNYIRDTFPNYPIQCSAQIYIKEFYEKFGFKAIGNVYDDGGIPHITMEKH